MKTQIARKGPQIIQHGVEWGKQNKKGGSKISRNLGTIAAATTGQIGGGDWVESKQTCGSILKPLPTIVRGNHLHLGS